LIKDAQLKRRIKGAADRRAANAARRSGAPTPEAMLDDLDSASASTSACSPRAGRAVLMGATPSRCIALSTGVIESEH
jgi:hypothetical protein